MAKPSLLRNIIANLGGYVTSVVITLMIAPYTIRQLGDNRYGAWSIISDLIGYYGLLDLGFRGAVAYFVARHLARKEMADIRSVFSSAFYTLAGLGSVVALIGLGLAAFLQVLFPAPTISVTEIRVTLVLMSFMIGMSLPMEVYSATLMGFQRVEAINAVEIISRILTAIATYFVLKTGGLIELSLVLLAGRLFVWVWNAVYVARLLDGFFPSWHSVASQRIRDLSGYGMRNFVGQTAMLVINRADLFFVAAYLGLKWATYYTIGATMIRYLAQAISAITRPFTPRFSEMYATGDRDAINVFFRGLRLAGVFSWVVAAGLAGFGPHFLRLWVGPQYVQGTWTYRSDTVLLLLLAANLPRLLQSVTHQLLFGMARVRVLMWMGVLEAVANLLFTLALVRPLGLAGVAIGTLIPALLSQLVAMPIYTARLLDVPTSTFLRRGFAQPAALGLILVLINTAITYSAPPASWAMLVLEVAASVVVTAPILWTIGLSHDERQQLSGRLRTALP